MSNPVSSPYVPRDFDEAELIGWQGYFVRCSGCRTISILEFGYLRRHTRCRQIEEVAHRLVCRKDGTKPDRVDLYADLIPGDDVRGQVSLPLFGAVRKLIIEVGHSGQQARFEAYVLNRTMLGKTPLGVAPTH